MNQQQPNRPPTNIFDQLMFKIPTQNSQASPPETEDIQANNASTFQDDNETNLHSQGTDQKDSQEKIDFQQMVGQIDTLVGYVDKIKPALDKLSPFFQMLQSFTNQNNKK